MLPISSTECSCDLVNALRYSEYVQAWHLLGDEHAAGAACQAVHREILRGGGSPAHVVVVVHLVVGLPAGRARPGAPALADIPPECISGLRLRPAALRHLDHPRLPSCQAIMKPEPLSDEIQDCECMR